MRIAAIKVTLDHCDFIVMSVYMPTNDADNLESFIDCLGEVNAIIESCNVESVYILGDFNSQPGLLFGMEFMNFCAEQNWTCADVEHLGVHSNAFTYIRGAHGTTSWLDHIVTTELATKTINRR